MPSFFIEHLPSPLKVTILTTEGKLLGHFQSSNISENGIFIDGEVHALLDTLRLLDMSTCLIEVELPHQRPLRSTVRVGFHSISRTHTWKNMKVFLRFVRMNSDYRRRYAEMLYACPASSL